VCLFDNIYLQQQPEVMIRDQGAAFRGKKRELPVSPEDGHILMADNITQTILCRKSFSPLLWR
jgi:hypothetical protein